MRHAYHDPILEDRGAVLFDDCDRCAEIVDDPARHMDAVTAAALLDRDRRPLTVAEAKLAATLRWALAVREVA